jgi:hypothetical protein
LREAYKAKSIEAADEREKLKVVFWTAKKKIQFSYLSILNMNN